MLDTLLRLPVAFRATALISGVERRYGFGKPFLSVHPAAIDRAPRVCMAPNFKSKFL